MGLSFIIQKWRSIRVVYRRFLRIVPIPTIPWLWDTKMWYVMTLRHSNLPTQVYVMRLTWFLKPNIALHCNGLGLRNSAMLSMNSVVQNTRQVWSSRLNLHTLHPPFVWRNLMVSDALFMFTIISMLLLFQRKQQFLERMFSRTTWLVARSTVHST